MTDTADTWPLRPQMAIGPLTFGMSSAQVCAILDSEPASRRSYERSQGWPDLTSLSYTDPWTIVTHHWWDHLVQVDLPRFDGPSIWINGVRLDGKPIETTIDTLGSTARDEVVFQPSGTAVLDPHLYCFALVPPLTPEEETRAEHRVGRWKVPDDPFTSIGRAPAAVRAYSFNAGLELESHGMHRWGHDDSYQNADL